MSQLWRFLILCYFISKIQTFQTENECMFQDNCERCLNTHLNCSWCTDKKYEKRYRCLTQSQLLEYGCSAERIWSNDAEVRLQRNARLRDWQSVNKQAVQIQPQVAFVKLVKAHPQRLKLSYRPARNNPLDLYFLMDLTWTMRDDKATLVTMGAELAAALRNLTVNYRLGFGSFADKPAMPMIMPQMRENPCAAEHEVCEATYSYRHRLALTERVDDFVASVNASRVTGNLDNLEGGLDALMQVLVCSSAIGWEPGARKIVLLATDGFMHFAGDGRLAGVTRPNDKRCHLSPNGEYLAALDYDYPSLEEVYRELLKRKVNVIFAVTEAVVETYKQLSALMHEVSNVEILSADSSNIRELIGKSYESFVKRTQFFDDSPAFIRIDYETDCGGQFTTLRQRSFCSNVEMGKEIDFYINVTLTDFPTDGVYTRKILIEESSLSERLELQVEIQPPCPCNEEADPNDEDGRFQCTGNGFMLCGMCRCDEGWTGTFCSCPSASLNTTTTESIENLCRKPFLNPPELGPICSNRGECDCGNCFCFPGYTGQFCECPQCDADCDPERASCVCGRCVCREGWSGVRCTCRESLDGCVGPTGEICSERGQCECNGCSCNDPYVGRFCEIGSESENKLCIFYEPCVACLIDQKLGTHLCRNASEVCSAAEKLEHYTYAFVTEEIESGVRCLVRLENKFGLKCDHFFTYTNQGYSQNSLLIQVNSCEPVNYYAIIGYVSTLTFLLGLSVIVLVMLCLREKDRREFAHFEADQRLSVLNESPIYKNPVMEYHVPQQLIEKNNRGKNPFT